MPARKTAKSARKSAGARRGGSKTAVKKSENSAPNVPATRMTGTGSATGVAIQEANREDLPQGEDRGSTVEIVGGAPEPDMLEGSQPKGDQAEPAQFTSNGSLEPRTIGTPSGPVPVAAVTTDAEHADVLVQKAVDAQSEVINRSPKDKKLSDATISRIGGAELRAIATKRGYEFAEAGTRATRASFARAQDEDENLIEE